MKAIPATTKVSVARKTPPRNASSVTEFRKLNNGSSPGGGEQFVPVTGDVLFCAAAGWTSREIRSQSVVVPVRANRLSWLVTMLLDLLTSVATDRVS